MLAGWAFCTVTFLFVNLIINFVSINGGLYDAKALEVQISNGRIRGEYGSLDGENYVVFKGVPYAAPPVGTARFQLPIELANWKGVMNGTTFRSCLQNVERKTAFMPINLKVKKEEDCLFLNVFAPPKVENTSFAVIVWIHGGDFQTGSSADYRPEPILRNFVSRKIIFVAINYRLGAFGFASSGDSILPGNFGLWDQIEALKWVQRNIAAFGGDPRSVTLAGHGSGAASASILALSPKAEGSLNLTGNEYFGLEHIFHDDYFEFVPREDGPEGVIPDSIERLLTKRPKIPMIIGTTRDEAAWHLMMTQQHRNLNLTNLSPDQAESAVQNLTSQFTEFTNHKLITEGCIYEFVTSLNNPSFNGSILKDGLLNMYSNFWFHAPASRLATFYEQGKVPVYLYSFDHTIRKSTAEREKKAHHGTDLTFLFDLESEFISHYPDTEWQTDKRITEIFAQFLTNFAKFGDPTPMGSGLPEWSRFNSRSLNYYSIGPTPKMHLGYNWRGHVFWNDYAKKLDSVDVGNLDYIAALKDELYQYKLATFISLGCAALFFTILVGLGCYCTRKDPEEEEL